MQYTWRYILLFLTAIVLQLFLFDTVNLGPYVNPLVYIAFVILLPMNTPSVAVLLAGFAMGVLMDVFSGTGGIHTIAALFTSYIRPFLLNVIVGKEYVMEGGIPSAKSLGTVKFMRYASIIVFAQCIVFFTLEAMNWQYFYLVLLKIAVSGGITLLFVWLLSLLFTVGVRKKA